MYLVNRLSKWVHVYVNLHQLTYPNNKYWGTQTFFFGLRRVNSSWRRGRVLEEVRSFFFWFTMFWVSGERWIIVLEQLSVSRVADVWHVCTAPGIANVFCPGMNSWRYPRAVLISDRNVCVQLLWLVKWYVLEKRILSDPVESVPSGKGVTYNLRAFYL